MNTSELSRRILKPLGIEFFPASGNLYFSHWRLAYVHTDHRNEVNFIKFPKVTASLGLDKSIILQYNEAVVKLKTMATLHGIPIQQNI